MTKMLLKPNQFSTYMRYATISKDGWDKLISHPLVIPNKDNAPLLIWGRMADTVEIDEQSLKPRCTGNNVGRLDALQVDVDNGCTIEEFVREYHRYSFQLYTTTGYGVKDGDRFRSVFPLNEPIYTDWLVPPVKQHLCEMFWMCDRTCFDRGHWQIVPCILKEGNPYRYIQHEGERLSFARYDFKKMASEYADDFHWRREIAEADRDRGDNHEGALRHIQTVFDSTTEGSRDTTVYKSIMWLKETVGCSYNEVISLRPPYGFDTEYMRKVDRLYNMR